MIIYAQKNVAFTYYRAMLTYGSGDYQSNPTLAAGDAKLSGDTGALGNLATLPDVQPASSVHVRVQLAQSEMNYDRIKVQFIDQTSPKEWEDEVDEIVTTPAPANVMQWLAASPNALQSGRVDSYIGAVASGVIAAASFASGALAAVWDVLTANITTVSSVGVALKNFLAALGSDNRPKVSADAHTSGQTVQATVGNVGGDVAGKVLGGGSTAISGVGARPELTVATLAELAQAQPPTNPTLEQALMLAYMRIRNQRDETSTQETIYNNAGTKVMKATLSDDGTTFTKAKLTAGP